MRISDWSSDVCSSDIGCADFLEQPQDALRSAVVEMVDDQAHGLSFGSGPIRAVAVDQRREFADEFGAENGGDPADVATGMQFDDVGAEDRKSTRLNSSH